MSYNLTLTNGTLLEILADGSADTTTTSISLVGKNYAGYGIYLNENFLKLLENFASTATNGNPTSPTLANPLTGQLWWDTTDKVLKAYNGTAWKEIANSSPSTTAPSNPQVGDQWYNTSTNILSVYNSTQWIAIGPAIPPGVAVTTLEANGLYDNISAVHTVGNIMVNNKLAAIISSDTSAFITQTPSLAGGFSSITPGYNIINNLVVGGVINSGAITSSGNIIASTINAATIGNTGATLTGSSFTASGTIIAATVNAATIGNAGAILTGSSFTASGTIIAATVNAATIGNAGAILTGSSFTASGTIIASTINAATIGNAGAILTGSSFTASGTIIASTINAATIGNTGATLTGSSFTASGTIIASTINAATIGNSGAIHTGSTFTASGTIIAATVNAATIGNAGATLTGTLSSGAQNNITSATSVTAVGTLTGLTVSGSIVPSANLSVNLGDTTHWFNNIYGTAIHAQYADLAERFASDQPYSAGTVVELGGPAEIMAAGQDLSDNVFGVISTNAAYLMNSGAGSNTTHPPVAVQGRVPVRVTGTIRKGDRLVSAGNGLARAGARNEITAWNVIGRALADKLDSGEGLIEAVVKLNS